MNTIKNNKSDFNKISKDFPILKRKINGKRLIYLDNAATSQKPKVVIDAVRNFYSKNYSNVHRGFYELSLEATEKYESARQNVAELINSDSNNLIFTSGTTESINLVSRGLDNFLRKGRKKILLTELEHHSNLVPWQELASRQNLELDFVKVKSNFDIDYNDLKLKLNEDVLIFAFSGMSNTIATKLDCKLICKLAKKRGVLTLIDGAQLVAHEIVDVKDIGCDFLCFSSHKMMGPSGIGALYVKQELINLLKPLNFGGGMISKVDFKNSNYKSGPEKFEAGTPNMEGAIGFGEAAKYLKKIGMDRISAYEANLTSYAINELNKLKQIKLYHPGINKGGAIISFNINGVHAHDVASLLDDFGVCIRAGHHCAMPLMKKFNLQGTARISFSFYNTKKDVDDFIKGLKKIILLFDGKKSFKDNLN